MRKNSPHSPKMMLGIAAIRSISAISGCRSRGGAYSEMYKAIAMPVGTAMIIAISAMRMPNGRIAAMPKCCGLWVIHAEVVRNAKPMNLKALAARRSRKTRISPVITKTDHPDARRMPRKILSPVDGRATITRGMSSGTAGITRVCASEGMTMTPRPFPFGIFSPVSSANGSRWAGPA